MCEVQENAAEKLSAELSGLGFKDRRSAESLLHQYARTEYLTGKQWRFVGDLLYKATGGSRS